MGLQFYWERKKTKKQTYCKIFSNLDVDCYYSIIQNMQLLSFKETKHFLTLKRVIRTVNNNKKRTH